MAPRIINVSIRRSASLYGRLKGIFFKFEITFYINYQFAYPRSAVKFGTASLTNLSPAPDSYPTCPGSLPSSAQCQLTAPFIHLVPGTVTKGKGVP